MITEIINPLQKDVFKDRWNMFSSGRKYSTTSTILKKNRILIRNYLNIRRIVVVIILGRETRKWKIIKNRSPIYENLGNF